MNHHHRPWDIPSSSWLMKQTWYDLLFAHWKIDKKILKSYIPSELELDTFEGDAWIGVVPFRMSGIRLKLLPPIPFTSRFPEINVRTYVTYDGKPGVYFFSLDATNYFAVKTARVFYHLPYYLANIKVMKIEDTVFYESKRRDSNNQSCFKGWYKPTSSVYYSRQGSLEHWLTERYCLYTVHQNNLFRCEIDHKPWPLQNAEAEILINSMIPIKEFSMAHPPLLHFSKHLDVRLWGLEKIGPNHQ